MHLDYENGYEAYTWKHMIENKEFILNRIIREAFEETTFEIGPES